MKKEILVLGIESSCDETAAAVVADGRRMRSNVINSQIDIHRRYGGVVPEIASRNHTMAIQSVVDAALTDAHVTLAEVDAVAVTYGAGLVGALLVGVSYAKGLAYAAGKPLIAVNHIRGHIAANYIAHPDLAPPYLCLVVSGGHTALIRVTDYLHHERIGSTIDDAVGEAFDKVARVMDLPYPGGAALDRLAEEGAPNLPLPAMFKGERTYDVTYSGLKTAAVNLLHNAEQRGEKVNVSNMCASFRRAAIDALVARVGWAMEEFGERKIVLAGGVASNRYLRAQIAALAAARGANAYFPPPVLCTDNAAMIAAEGYYQWQVGKRTAGFDLNAVPNIAL